MGYIKTKNGKKIEISPYIEVLDRDNLRVHTEDCFGSHTIIVKRDSPVQDFGSIIQIIGKNGMISGDWRQMRNLVDELSEIFKELKNEEIKENTTIKKKLDEVI